MRIGVELIHIAEGVTGGLVPLLRGVLGEVFSGWPEHEVVLFYKAGNPPLFGHLPPQAQTFHLPHALYFPLLDVYASHLGLDVLFRTYPYGAEMSFPLARQVVLIPDLQHKYHPEFFAPEVLAERRASFAQALGQAGAVATLSEHARQTLRAHPAGRHADIFLTPPALGADGEGSGPDHLTDAERALLPGRDFFLYPANLWPHKNHRRVLEAFARFLRETGRPFELVLTGHPTGWDELAKHYPGLPVRHLGFVRRGLLRALLGRARALVFFSLYEGFGIPLLEAFAAGVPVACSDTTSLPEVGGDAVLACDPTDVAAMSAAMARVDQDEGLRARLAARGRERLRAYDYRDSAAQLVAGCARVAARASAPAPSPLPAIRRLNEMLAEIENDRAARLEAIRWLEKERAAGLEAIGWLEAQLRRSEADRAARLGVIHSLQAALERSGAEREAGGREIERLSAGLLRRLARRVLRPVTRAFRQGRAA